MPGLSSDRPKGLSYEWLAGGAEEEAEHLLVVGVGLGDGEGEVKGERRGAHGGHIDAEAEARGDAELIGVESDAGFHGAEVAEDRGTDHVVSREREIVLG